MRDGEPSQVHHGMLIGRAHDPTAVTTKLQQLATWRFLRCAAGPSVSGRGGDPERDDAFRGGARGDQRRQEESVESSPSPRIRWQHNDSAKEPLDSARLHEAWSAPFHHGTSTPVDTPEKKQKSGASMAPIDTAKSIFDAAKDPADLFHSACDMLPTLLEYFSVQDMRVWRVISEQTRRLEALL